MVNQVVSPEAKTNIKDQKLAGTQIRSRHESWLFSETGSDRRSRRSLYLDRNFLFAADI